MRAVFAFGAQKNLAIFYAVIVEAEVINILDPLNIHGEPFKPVGEFSAGPFAGNAAHLLKIGELRHLHPVAPHLPSQAPGAERRAFPIILNEADVMQSGVNAKRAIAFNQQRLRVRR